MNRSEILTTANDIVNGQREKDYNSPEQSFTMISKFWSTYLGYEVTAVDVAAMMALLKLARIASGHAKEDNWVDLAGYAACGGELESSFDWVREVN